MLRVNPEKAVVFQSTYHNRTIEQEYLFLYKSHIVRVSVNFLFFRNILSVKSVFYNI